MTAAALISRWTGPARRRGLLNDALLFAPIVLALSVLAWRLAGLPVGAAVLAVGVLVGLIVAWRRAARFDRPWLVGKLDGSRRDMEDSSELLFADPGTLGDLQTLQRQRLFDRLETGSPDALAADWRRRPIIAAWAVALVVIAGALLWPRGEDRPVVLSPAAESLPAVAGVPRLVGQNLRIIPPAYTGLPMRDEPRLDVRAPQGSRLEWTLRFEPEATVPALVTLGGAKMALRRSGDVWVASRVLDASFLYRVDAAAGRGPVPPLHRVDAIPDAPPSIRVVSPTESLSHVTEGQRTWTPVFAVTDDYGVAANARLRITLAMGEGENITFTEREIALTGSGSARDRRFSQRLDFAALGFGPGGDLVVQLIARDNRSPGPQEVRGPSLILRWPSANQAEGSGLEGMVTTTLPAYFRSQRQIIIDAEALVARQGRLSADDYSQRSFVIGGDQALLRARYSQFLGGETEGEPQLPTSEAGAQHTDDDGHDHGPRQAAPTFGVVEDVLAEFGHPHDDSPAASLDPETRELLRQAVDEMWQSEVQLKQGRPDLALPHANRALNFIKEVQRATRIFLQRVGPKLPPIDPTRRMTGEREGIASRRLPLAPVEAGDGPVAAAWRALGQGPEAVRGPVVLDALERWIGANGDRLPDALALSGAVDAVRRDPDCASCRQRLRALLWTAMERPTGDLVRRRPADDAGARYLGALEGGG
ncbi:DUF4175 family protein [Brevundimonas lenta]|uniref:DUF4175 domain-containing protein n=1 Tax=Brevundimonas lenta TaxID=424796 RepID=A0A7W6JFY5_9CAUL|nr:DUF4175 family protein [Brevundimonas lenta]MBB4084397.1 hypothetical protein [Brevundimonas lenta]